MVGLDEEAQPLRLGADERVGLALLRPVSGAGDADAVEAHGVQRREQSGRDVTVGKKVRPVAGEGVA